MPLVFEVDGFGQHAEFLPEVEAEHCRCTGRIRVHQPRNRRTCLGELIHIDGSDQAWLEAPADTKKSKDSKV